MAPNPIIIPGQNGAKWKSNTQRAPQGALKKLHVLSAFVLLVGILSVSDSSLTKRWIISGTGIESALLAYASFQNAGLLENGHYLVLLAALNSSFVVANTSWLLRPIFMFVCYCVILLTCLALFSILKRTLRTSLRANMHQFHFVGGKIASFNVPALDIDTEVSGLFVVRGITLSLSDLTIEAHGIELGLRLDEDLELALCSDYLKIRLFRAIEISDVYGNLKTEKSQMSFNDPSSVKNDGLPTFRSSQATQSASEASQNNHGSDAAKQTIPHGDPDAEARYQTILRRVKDSSQIHRSRKNIENDNAATQPSGEKEMRQAVCAKLLDVPTICHTPDTSIKVSVLQTVFPRLRRFLHRLPLLMRLTLNPLSYFHPIYISSISIAGPGERIKSLLEEHMFTGDESNDANMKELEEQMSYWLDSASFCLETTNLDALAHVPVTTTGDIATYIRTGDISVYRTERDSNAVRQCTHIGGADATLCLPVYLLPHHEHCLPFTRDPDEAEMSVSVHASLPTTFDQSLLDFAAALIKATDIINLQNFFDSQSGTDYSEQDQAASGQDSNDNGQAETEEDSTPSKVTKLAKRGLRKGLSKNAVGNKINDRWTKRTVARLAEKLEDARGDFGYTTTIPISLQPYRDTAESASKIVP